MTTRVRSSISGTHIYVFVNIASYHRKFYRTTQSDMNKYTTMGLKHNFHVHRVKMSTGQLEQ